MLCTFDTNVIIYAYDVEDTERHEVAQTLLGRALNARCVLTLQVLGETFNVLVNRKKTPIEDAVAVVHELRAAFQVVTPDESCLVDAMGAVRDHQWSFWDAMIWATARRAGCDVLISEDGHGGGRLLGVTVVNPFTDTPSPLLEKALAPA